MVWNHMAIGMGHHVAGVSVACMPASMWQHVAASWGPVLGCNLIGCGKDIRGVALRCNDGSWRWSPTWFWNCIQPLLYLT